jgi:PAS domain S-box-containing protein
MLRIARKTASTSSSLKKRNDVTGHNAQVISCVLLVFAWCGAVHAGNELEQWRKNADQIRRLAENDIPAAYTGAQRLQAELPADATPADRIKALNLLARTELYLGWTDLAGRHAQQAFEQANKQRDRIGQAEADLTIALNAVNQARIDKMSAAVMHSMDILDGVDRPDLLGESMLRTSMMYRRMEQVEDSVSVAMQAMEIAKQNGNATALAFAYQGLAAAYDLSEHAEEARDYYFRMREQARIAGSGLLEADALLGAGGLTVRLGRVDEGLGMIRDAINKYRSIGGPFYVAHGLVVLANSLENSGQPGPALPLLNEVADLYRQGANKIGLWWALKKRSAIYQTLGKIAEADADAEQSYRLAKEIDFPLYLLESSKQMASIAAARGEHQRAYRFLAEANEMAAKDARNKANQRMVDLARRYQTESKQREIDRLNRHNQQQAAELKQHELEQRWLWTVLGGSVVILAGAGFFLVRLRRSHRRLETLNTEVSQAKNKLQATLDTIPDLLFELGLDGRYHDYHSPRIDLLTSPAEYLLGKTVAEVIPSDAAAVIMSALREAHEQGFSTGKQFELALPHGNFWFELSVASKSVADGEEPRLIALSRDITERKRLEAQALQREQEFRVLVESSTDLIFRYDKHCRRIYANPAVARLVGKPAGVLLNSTPSEAKILSDDQAGKLMQMIRQVLTTGRPAESEVECLAANGQLHYFHNRYAPEFDAHGEVVGVISIARDVTERKHADSALRESEQRYRLVFENSPVSIWEEDFSEVKLILDELRKAGVADIEAYFDSHPETVRQCAERVKIIDVNQAALALHGASSKEGFFAGLLSTFTPESFATFRQELVALWHRETEMQKEAVVRTLAGEPRNVTVHFTICPGYEKSLSKVLVSLVDITERKQAEEALIAREREFRTLAENLPDNIARYDRQGGLLYVNPELEKTLGGTYADKQGMTVREFFPNGEYDDYALLLDTVLASGKSGEMERIVPAPDNSSHTIHNIRMVAEYGQHGEVIGALVIGRDITERKLAENALRDSEEKYRTLIQKIQTAVIVHGPDTQILTSNPVAQEILGFSEQQLHGKTVMDPAWHFYHEDGRIATLDDYPVMKVMASGKPLTNYVLGVHRPGQQQDIWALTNANPVFGKDGEIIQVIVTFIDITQRKQAEQLLWLMDFALNQIREAVYVINLPDLQFLNVNAEACRALGYSREELLQLTVFDIDPDSEPEAMAALQREIDSADAAVFERHHRTKDGRIFPVEISAKVFEYEGRPTSIAMARDITERKRAEAEILALNADLEQRVQERTEELRQQTHYLRTLIDTLPMMAWLKDKDSRFLVVNQSTASACGHGVDDLVGKTGFDCWPRKYAETYQADDEEVMATRQRKTIEELFFDIRIGEIWMETFKAPVLDENDSVLGTVGISRDISDRKALEIARESALAEAERLVQLRSEFMARMSHELRTPLNGIMGYAQILLAENRGNERQGAMLKVIQQSGEYLLNLINDILDFAKIDAGKQELNLNDIRLPNFLRNLANIITIKAEQKGLSFICDVADDVPAGIRADETRLRQVLLNLLSNAVKYSERGRISLRVTVLAPGRLRFEVQDYGIGIDSAHLETIFHAFEQTGDWHHRTGGTGLGLPISRELIRLMGSDIHVISHVGEGSIFWFDLTVPVVDVSKDVMAVEQPVVGYQGARRRILVVDDVNENRAMLIDMLDRLGFNISEAVNGSECLQSVERHAPDLILLDMVMPEMNGLETTRRLRRLPGLKQTPIIAVSASASDYDVDEAMKAGVNVFVAKPIDLKKLMVQLAALLKLEWIYAFPEIRAAEQKQLNKPIVIPPFEEMEILHRLAQEGSMRDIIRQAQHLEELDDNYRAFAAQLRTLAQSYQSKAVLDLVERHLNKTGQPHDQ